MPAPNSEKLFSASRDKTIKMWDTNTGHNPLAMSMSIHEVLTVIDSGYPPVVIAGYTWSAGCAWS